MENRIEITEEIAERIISSRMLIEEALVPYKGIEVTYVGYVDAEGEPFLWEDSDEPYAIVSFKATNNYQLGKSLDLFEQGDFEGATSKSLSMRMNVDKAKGIVAGATSGTLVCHEVEVEDEDTGDTVLALLPKNFIPAEAKTAKKVSLKELMDARKAKGAEVKVNEAVTPESN